jgi:hypothetical protein
MPSVSRNAEKCAFGQATVIPMKKANTTKDEPVSLVRRDPPSRLVEEVGGVTRRCAERMVGFREGRVSGQASAASNAGVRREIQTTPI